MKIMQTEAHVKKRLREIVLPQYKGKISWFWPLAGLYGKRGQPDLVINANGYFVGVEVKSPSKGDILDPHQILIRQDIVEANGIYMTVYNEKSVFYLEMTIQNLLRSVTHERFACDDLRKEVDDFLEIKKLKKETLEGSK